MLPNPLHPAIVHFPIVFSVLLPLAAAAAFVAIRKGAHARWIWAIPLAFSVALAGSAWLALETGESEEDAVEAVVAESAIHEHEEAAEIFLVLSAVVAGVAAVGMAGGTLGSAARAVTIVGSLVVLGAGIQVGKLGGELVYEHGAASAYTDGAAITAGDHDEDDEH